MILVLHKYIERIIAECNAITFTFYRDDYDSGDEDSNETINEYIKKSRNIIYK